MSTIWADKEHRALVPNTYKKRGICMVHLEIAQRVFSFDGINQAEKQAVLELVNEAFDYGKRMDARLARYRRETTGVHMSPEYLAANVQLHSAPRGFGGSGWRWADQVAEIIKHFKIKSWLDYGCGEETLWEQFREDYPGLASAVKYWGWDPAVEKRSEWKGRPRDLVTCTDVLEHVEPDRLEDVLNQIFPLADRVVFFNIALQPANKKLPDGRNAHLILETPEWWMKRLSREWLHMERLPSPRPAKDLTLLMYGEPV